MATTGNLWSVTDKWGTSKGTRYYACPLSTLENALNNTSYVPSNAKITGLKLKVVADMDLAGLGNIYFRYGFGSSGSISQPLIDEYKFPNWDPNEIPSGGVDITSYLSSNMSPFSLKRNYGDYLTFYFSTSNILSKTMAVESVVLEITYDLYYTATFKNHDGTTLQTVSVKSGTKPTYSGATPTKAQDYRNIYTFSGWSPSVGAITSNTTYTAQFASALREYTVSVECFESESGEKCSVTGDTVYHYGDTIALTAINIPPYHKLNSWLFFAKGSTVRYYTNPLYLTIDDEVASAVSEWGILSFNCYITHTGYHIKATVSPEGAGIIERHNVYYDVDDNENFYFVDVLPDEGYTVLYEERNYQALKAVPNNGYKFVQWEDGSTANPRQINISGDVTYGAVFEKAKYTLDFSNVMITKENGITTEQTPIRRTFYEGDVLELTPYYISDKDLMIVFDHWTIGGNESGSEVPLIYTVTKAETIIAVFKKLQMNFESVKIYYPTGADLVSPDNPLIGGDETKKAQIVTKLSLKKIDI